MSTNEVQTYQQQDYLIVDKELLILTAVFKSAYRFGSIVNNMKPEYFDNKNYRLLWSNIQGSYFKYKKLLSANELQYELHTRYNLEQNQELYEAFLGMCNFQITGYDENFLNKKVESFICNRLTQTTFINIAKRRAEGQIRDIDDWDSVRQELKSLNFSIVASKPMSLMDIDEVWKNNPSNFEGSAMVIKSSIPSMNGTFTYKGYTRKALYQLIAAPGVGKSTLLTSESASAAIQGFKVIHTVLGDLTSYDIWIRILSRLFGDPAHSVDKLVLMSKEQIMHDMSQCPDNRFKNVAILAYPSKSITVEQWAEDVIRTRDEILGGHVDMIVADYADNFSSGENNMYLRGGELYSGLHKLMWDLNAVGLTASQPKTHLWEQEFMTDQNAAAESGQKAHILDFSMNLGKPTKLTDGTGLVVGYTTKVRRGRPNYYYYLRIHYTNCSIEELSFDQYMEMKKHAATSSVDPKTQAANGL